MDHFLDKMDHLFDNFWQKRVSFVFLFIGKRPNEFFCSHNFQKLLYFLKLFEQNYSLGSFPTTGSVLKHSHNFHKMLYFFENYCDKIFFPIIMYTIWYFVLECFSSEASVVILRVGSDCSAYCSTATRFVQISRQMVTPTLLRPRTTTEVARVQCKSWTASLRWATVEKAVTGTSTCRRRMCVMTPGTSCGRPANINKSWPIRRSQL